MTRLLCLLALVGLMGGCEQKPIVDTKAAQCIVYDEAGYWKGTTWDRQGEFRVNVGKVEAHAVYRVECFTEDENGTFTFSR